ncbi:MAG: SprT family zinc-dependent metalloprotease [Desulfobacterium sp.]|nr:SprT family zinc-dependent metalloprotease [Desulfobacterium sp.]
MNARRVKDIDYILLPGTRRKTTDIVIERNGVVTVRPPKGVTPEQADAVVDSKRMWIYRSLAEWRDLNPTAVVREWVNGESFLYLGRSYRLSLNAVQAEDLILKQGQFCLKRSLIDQKGEGAARKAFESFYCTKGENRLNRRVEFFAPKVGVKPSGLKVKDLGFRWASCTKGNLLQFHWKCMMAPPKIIDYMVVHELCHMHHRNHMELFWNEVDKVMPDYQERKLWLKKYGAGLDL